MEVAVEVKHEVAEHEAVAEAHGEHGAAGAEAHGEHAAGAHGHEAPVSNFAGIGVGELLVFIGFLGAFLFAFFNNLAKRPIIVENDPYLKENEKLVVTYS